MVDPYASSKDLMKEYHFGLVDKPSGKYDAVIVAVNHAEYVDFDEAYFHSLMGDEGIVVDIKGMYRNTVKKLTYWSL